MNKDDNKVRLFVEFKENIICEVNIKNDITVSINSKFNPVSLYYFFEYIRNDVLLYNIDRDTLFEFLNKIYNYENWLENIYKPKFEKTLDNFFYQVYLWVREDLKLFCLYTGLNLVEK